MESCSKYPIHGRRRRPEIQKLQSPLLSPVSAVRETRHQRPSTLPKAGCSRKDQGEISFSYIWDWIHPMQFYNRFTGRSPSGVLQRPCSHFTLYSHVCHSQVTWTYSNQRCTDPTTQQVPVAQNPLPTLFFLSFLHSFSFFSFLLSFISPFSFHPIFPFQPFPALLSLLSHLPSFFFVLCDF